MATILPLAPARPRRGRGRDAAGLPLRAPRAAERLDAARAARLAARGRAPRVLRALPPARRGSCPCRRGGRRRHAGRLGPRPPCGRDRDHVGRGLRGCRPPSARPSSCARSAGSATASSLPSSRSAHRRFARCSLRARTRLRHRLRDVAAGLGGAPWIQTLVRLVGGGDGASPVPAATKAAAVGIGALALVGRWRPRPGPRTTPPARPGTQSPTAPGRCARASRLDFGAAAVARDEDRPGRDVRRTEPRAFAEDAETAPASRAPAGPDRTRTAASSTRPRAAARPGSGHEGSRRHDAVTQPSTDGHDGGGGERSTSTGSGRDGSGHDSTDGGSSGSSSGSDGGSEPTTTSLGFGRRRLGRRRRHGGGDRAAPAADGPTATFSRRTPLLR